MSDLSPIPAKIGSDAPSGLSDSGSPKGEPVSFVPSSFAVRPEWCIGEEHETMLSLHHIPTGVNFVCRLPVSAWAHKAAIRRLLERIVGLDQAVKP